MGPNNKRRAREQYIKYRLKVLKELGIPWPPDEVIEKMKDEEHMSEIQVDAVFLGCIQRSD